MEKDTIFNTDRSKEEAIKWTLGRAKELFIENKKLIIGHCKITGFRTLQALTMDIIVLPSYTELVDSLTTMSMAFESAMMTVEAEECARLIRYLVFYKGNEKEQTK